MTITKLQEFLEVLPDGLEVSWNQSVDGIFFFCDLEDEFWYKDMCYTHKDLLNLETLLPILEGIIDDEDKVFLTDKVWGILDKLELLLETVPQEDLIVSFGSNVRVACTNSELLIEETVDE